MLYYKVICGRENIYRDEESYHDVLNYIFNPIKCVRWGIGPMLSSPESAADEMLAAAEQFGKNKGKRVRHSVLSFPENIQLTVEDVNTIAQKLIRYYAPDYQIAYAVHANTASLHIHFVMNQISYRTGLRYTGRKYDYCNFLNYIKSVTGCPVRPVKDSANDKGANDNFD